MKDSERGSKEPRLETFIQMLDELQYILLPYEYFSESGLSSPADRNAVNICCVEFNGRSNDVGLLFPKTFFTEIFHIPYSISL